MTQFLSPKLVAKRYGKCRETIWRWASDPHYAGMNFPKPRKIGMKTTVWDEADLDAWDATFVAAAE